MRSASSELPDHAVGRSTSRPARRPRRGRGRRRRPGCPPPLVAAGPAARPPGSGPARRAMAARSATPTDRRSPRPSGSPTTTSSTPVPTRGVRHGGRQHRGPSRTEATSATTAPSPKRPHRPQLRAHGTKGDDASPRRLRGARRTWRARTRRPGVSPCTQIDDAVDVDDRSRRRRSPGGPRRCPVHAGPPRPGSVEHGAGIGARSTRRPSGR